MSHVLITAGPTREYLDPVRYLSNGSSGKMAKAIAEAFLQRDWKVTIVSGPVAIEYPAECEVVPVVTTSEMLEVCLEKMPEVSGVFAVAAPCDFRPVEFQERKIKKEEDQEILTVEFEKTPDILATLSSWAERIEERYRPWMVGFALETDDGLKNATAKKQRKGCQAIVLNRPISVGSDRTSVQLIGESDQVEFRSEGNKAEVASSLADWAMEHLQKS